MAASSNKRPNAGIGPHDVIGPDRRLEEAIEALAEIVRLVGEMRTGPGAVLVGHVGRADQREVALVGDREDDAFVGILQDIGLVALVELRVTMWLPLMRRTAALELTPSVPPSVSLTQGPAALTIDLGPHDLRAAAARHAASPARRRPARRALSTGGARAHVGAAGARVHRVEHHEARILHPAVRIDEALGQPAPAAGAPSGDVRKRTRLRPQAGCAAAPDGRRGTGRAAASRPGAGPCRAAGRSAAAR